MAASIIPSTANAHSGLAAFAQNLQIFCDRIDRLSAIVVCGYCEEEFPASTSGYCFELEAAICDDCREEHAHQCEGCSDRAHADYIELLIADGGEL